MSVLQRLRREKGISQYEMAQKVGTYPQRLSSFETGYLKASVKMRAVLAQALNVPEDVLFDTAGGVKMA